MLAHLQYKHRLKRSLSLLGISALLALPAGIGMNLKGSPAMAAEQFTMVQKQIQENGKVVSSPYSFVSGGTTYMPLWYVIQALKQANIANQWTGQSWDITASTFKKPNQVVGSGSVPVYVNGVLIYRTNKFAVIDPSSHQLTTFIPIYTIMQVLKQAGVQNTWDGKHWSITSASSSTSSSTQTTGSQGSTTPGATSLSVAGVSASTSLGATGLQTGNPTQTNNPPQSLSALIGAKITNQAVNDANYWQRAGNDVYIYATSYNPATSSYGTEPLMNIQPGQPIYLLVYSSKINVGQVQWSMNSPDATVTPVNQNYTWSLESHVAQSYQFVAQKPGIYTLQAQTNGDYSVPLVLTVGLNQLTGTPVATADGQSGIKPLPSNLPATPWSTGAWPNTTLPADSSNAALVNGAVDGVLYKQYAPIDGWIPVYGKVTTPGIKQVVVDFSNNSSTKEQNYTLPVNSDGTFGALLEVPVSGNVNVAFLPNFLTDLTNQNMQAFYNDVYSVSNTAATLTQQQQGLLASATMDFNLNPAINQMASTLVENSPSMDSAIAAIANFAGDKVKYDWPDYQAGKSIWQDSNGVWSSNSGVCQDIAELSASMLKSVGIPTLTVIGMAPKGQTTDDHEWIQSWDGNQWLTIDPTWDSPSDPQTVVVDTLSNEYTTLTDSFQSSHTADQSMIGTWQ